MNYSIIIPHKNIPHLLQRCLDSIPRREDVQIIVVDDNSDPAKVDFANFPGLNDPYVQVIFAKNKEGRKGAGYARNVGIAQATGKWLIFADADDYFMPSFSEALDKYINDENEIIYFYITSTDIDTMQLSNRHLFTIYYMDQIQQTNNWDLACTLISPFGKFIKRDFFINNNIYFREVRYGDDILFGVEVATFATSKKITNEVIYCITSREGSLSTSNSLKSLLVGFKEIDDAILFLKKAGKKQYLTEALYDIWLKIAKINILRATLLVPKMICACGIKPLIPLFVASFKKWLKKK